MENILKYETMSYFSCEILSAIGIFLNLIFFLFFKRKLNIKRISDFITCGVFILNILVLTAIGFSANDFNNINYSFSNGLITLDKTSLLLKLSINIFMLFFVLTTYKLTRKARFKTPVINSILLIISIFAGLISQNSNFIITYILFDIVAILIYKYASNMRIRKDDCYSVDFVLTTATASMLFFGFYFLTFFIKDSIQLNIIYVCMALAFFLKAGMFPFSNYLTDKNYKTNIPYSILLFCFLPWISVIAYNNITKFINYSNEIYQFTMIVFIVLCGFYFGILTLKQKNLVKFLAKTNYCLISFSILNILILSNNEISLKYSTMVSFCMLSMYSLLTILKINLKIQKINLSAIKGIFLNNKFFTSIFSILLLIISNVVPSGILKFNIQILNNIYSYDKIAFIAVFIYVLAGILILFASLKIIKNLYNFEFRNAKEKLTKKTAPNYAVSLIIILFLIVGIFL